MEPGAWERFGALNLNFHVKYNKVLFIFYNFNGNTAGGVPISFKVMVDEIELRTARSQTVDSNKISNAVG